MDTVVIKDKLMTWHTKGKMMDWLCIELADFAV